MKIPQVTRVFWCVFHVQWIFCKFLRLMTSHSCHPNVQKLLATSHWNLNRFNIATKKCAQILKTNALEMDFTPDFLCFFSLIFFFLAKLFQNLWINPFNWVFLFSCPLNIYICINNIIVVIIRSSRNRKKINDDHHDDGNAVAGSHSVEAENECDTIKNPINSKNGVTNTVNIIDVDDNQNVENQISLGEYETNVKQIASNDTVIDTTAINAATTINTTTTTTTATTIEPIPSKYDSIGDDAWLRQKERQRRLHTPVWARCSIKNQWFLLLSFSLLHTYILLFQSQFLPLLLSIVFFYLLCLCIAHTQFSRSQIQFDFQ